MRFHSTKHDGSLHYRFDVEPVQQSDATLAVYVPFGTPMRSYRGDRALERHLLCIYWPDRYWNLHVVWEPDWSPREHYVNIATPATWDDGAIRCSDLDLDLILPADGRPMILDDVDEFALHADRMAYPLELIETCLATAADVASMMRERRKPFDRQLFDWRPGRALPRF